MIKGKNKNLDQIVKKYEEGVRHEDTGKIDYIIAFGSNRDSVIKGERIPELVTPEIGAEYQSILEFKLKKDQSDIKYIDYLGGAGTNLQDYRLVSPLLSFQKRERESNAGFLIRILNHAKKHRHFKDFFDEKKDCFVDAIEFLTINLKKPVHVLYYERKD